MSPWRTIRTEATDAPDWYKDAIIYELHVRAFCDSNGDGIGDFQGLTEKLDYLQDLGITAIWLLPFFPSPLRDDGYDISDYRGIHPAYGTLKDFKAFVREAHRRNLRVITELVINHTSDQHPWFQRARRARPDSAWRNFYVWSNNPAQYSEARIIFQDFESSNWTWDPVAKAYFWHRFYSHQPDLNYDNPLVRREILRLFDFWFKLGVDGLRLDAVPYLFEREGTNCENLPETHQFLKELRRHVDENFKDRMLLAEANQWPEDAAEYFGAGDECHMAFHFPIMPRLFIALRMEDRFPIVESLRQTPAIPESAQWAIFLRNHDELTLEMVTDEERDYMYRLYAKNQQARINLGIRRRLAPLMRNHRRQIELMKSLLFSLPGTPVTYYGDEIGMGDNIYLGDRNGVRTPMQWSADRNAGFSRADPQSLYLPPIIDQEYHYEAVNVEIQQNNPGSLLWWTKRIINLRRNFKAFGRGTVELLYPDNRKILAFIRRYERECILVVANFSRLFQFVELNLSEFRGMVPVTLYGRIELPPIGDSPYVLTLGAYSFVWFSLEYPSGDQATGVIAKKDELPVLEAPTGWKALFDKKSLRKLERILPRFIVAQRWFQGKTRRTREAFIEELIWLRTGKSVMCLALIRVEFAEGEPELYSLPISFAGQERASTILDTSGHAVICSVSTRNPDHTGILYDATIDPEFGVRILDMIARHRGIRGSEGELTGKHTAAFKTLSGRRGEHTDVWIVGAGQTNTSVRFDEKFILKFYRKLEEGINAESEVGRFLLQKGFPFSPPFAGELEYRYTSPTPRDPTCVAVLHGWVENHGDSWKYTLDWLSQYIEEMLARRPKLEDLVTPQAHVLDLVKEDFPPECVTFLGSYLESARLMGERTAEMHLSLASYEDDPSFKPEKFTRLYQRSLYQSVLNLTGQAFRALKQALNTLPDSVRQEAEALLLRREEIRDRLRSLLDSTMTSFRIRCHGDYHLGKILNTGNDFVIMDFEGEPARSISERRLKRSCLRDVTGMFRSFHYAGYSSLLAHTETGLVREDNRQYTGSLILFWQYWVGAAFLKSYLEKAGQARFLPQTGEELKILFDALLLEKAIYELGYELNNPPHRVQIPLDGIRQILA
ncbi:MAG TPA: maltose alpha-D-glucosyltransferase [Desulfomonilaceae bacterium]|nr:maltose alpha-D-glucosyltransferase [Desulfomonilaceae bacterium]